MRRYAEGFGKKGEGIRKSLILMSCFLLFSMIFFSACNRNNTEHKELDIAQGLEESEQADSGTPAEGGEEQEDSTKTQETEGNEPLDWPEITEDGVDEELLYENLDKDVLEKVAAELQALAEETMKEEKENPEIVLSKGYVRVFKSERYNKVLSMGDSAMKPLYFIIYKSPNAGMYEHMCAMALYELSGYDFTKKDGSLTWATSKEFIESFNEKMLADRNSG